MAAIATCFYFLLTILPLSFDSFALPVSIKKDLGFLTLTISDVLCDNIKIGKIYGQYDTHGLNITIGESTTMHCYVYISVGSYGAGNLSIDVAVEAGKNLLITTVPDDKCIVSKPNVSVQTLAPSITNLKMVKGNISADILAAMTQMMGPAIEQMLRIEYTEVAAQIANYTKLPDDVLPDYFAKYQDINTLSIAELKKTITDLPKQFGAEFRADIPTKNSFSVGATTEDNIDLQTQYAELKIAATVDGSAVVSFKNVTCDDKLATCVLEDGAQLYNIRAKNGENDIPLINSFLGPLVSGFANSAINTSTFNLTIDNTYYSTVFKFVDAVVLKFVEPTTA